ncbi:MAG: cyclic nucleotide-binding domain-containing protein [Thermoplasmata archaeon]|jgi:CRP-like cAMP-binding protein
MDTSEVWYGVITSKDSPEEPRLRVSDHPFFRGLDPELIEAAGQRSVDTTYETDDLIVRQGEVANRFHLIFHGKVAIEVGGPEWARRTVQTIGSGEVLGWSWIAPPYVWQFDGRVLKETRVVSLDASVLRSALLSRPAEAYRFLQRLLPVIGQRLENTRVQMLELQCI